VCPVVQESHFIDPVELTRLSWDVGGRELQPLVQIVGFAPINQFRNDQPVPLRVKAVYKTAMELRQVLDDANHDLEERVEIWSLTELVIDLSEDCKDIHGSHSTRSGTSSIRSWPRTLARLGTIFSRLRLISSHPAQPLQSPKRFRVTRRTFQDVLGFDILLLSFQSHNFLLLVANLQSGIGYPGILRVGSRGHDGRRTEILGVLVFDAFVAFDRVHR
jgi:hypothetical protein